MALALGLGANAAIFRVVDAVLLQPLPYRDADRLMMPWEFSEDMQQRLGFDRLPSSPADFFDYAGRNTTFERLASMRTEQVNLTGRGEPERIGAVRVSAEFFDVLGVQPIIGRSFQPGDEMHGRVVLIGQSLWRRSFGSDPGVAGRVVALNGEPATILGVLPAWFRFPAAGELPQGFGFSLNPVVWTLDVLTPEQRRNRGGKSLALVGRLKAGVTIADAQADLANIAADIAREFPATNAGWTVHVLPLREQLVGSLRPALIALVAAVGVVLLIACANVANLLLVRTAGRQREICVRYALGASRSSLVWESLAESVILAVVGGLAGLLVASWMLRALLTLAPAYLPAAAEAGLDAHVVIFSIVLSLVTAVLFGAAPAWHSTRYETAEGLREGSRGMVGGRHATRTRNALVVLEVALAVTLLIGSMLLVQTFIRLIHVNAGFRTDRVLTMEIALPRTAYTPASASTFFVALIDRLAGLPGVEAAGLTSGVPLSGSENLLPVTAEGRPRPEPGHELISDYRVITAGYFEALGIPLLEGDSIGPSADVRRVWVNQTMARVAWPGRSAVGRRLKLTNYDRDGAWYTVAGVVGDTRYTGLDRALRPQVYVHFSQDPREQMAVVLRSYGDPTLLVNSARQAVQALDPNQPIARVRTMEQIVTTSVANRRFQMVLIGIFATVAVTLAVVGLYAVVSYSVGARTHEMGLRLALGARPANLVRLVLREGLQLVTIGIAVGVGAALVLTRFLEALLFGVDARDTTTFIVAPAILFVAALLGCLAPARRAMRVDPAVALRAE